MAILVDIMLSHIQKSVTFAILNRVLWATLQEGRHQCHVQKVGIAEVHCVMWFSPLDSSTFPLFFRHPQFFSFYLCGLKKWDNWKDHQRQNEDSVFSVSKSRGSSTTEMTLDPSFLSRSLLLLSHYRTFTSLTLGFLSSVSPLQFIYSLDHF